MKPLGKAMKIGYANKIGESETLRHALDTYRQTPHPATGIPPASILFRDGTKTCFPRRTFTEKEVQEAEERDHKLKLQNEEKINASKYKKESEFHIGDHVLTRNMHKTRKFEPTFLSEPYKIINNNPESNKIMIQSQSNTLVRHPDDIKPYYGYVKHQDNTHKMAHIPYEGDTDWPIYEETEAENESIFDNQIFNRSTETSHQPILRRSNRLKRPNSRYMEFVTDF